MRRSFLLTAAGQFRIHTGFPLGPGTDQVIGSGTEISTTRFAASKTPLQLPETDAAWNRMLTKNSGNYSGHSTARNISRQLRELRELGKEVF